jgi:hypothetical protein
MSLSDLNSSKLNPISVKVTRFFFQNYNSTLIQKIKIPRPLSQVSASNRSNIFTFTLISSEGRAGETWEPSNKSMLFIPPHIEVSPALQMTFGCRLNSYHNS